MILYPNAKINIGLNIVEKRTDGYHNIETLFYPLQLCDILEIVKSETFEYSQTGLVIDGDIESNLVVKAFRLMQKCYAIDNVKVHLHKVIPFGAGLGGGSADAAYAIKGLNSIFELGLGENEMAVLVGELGSDCPFFILNRPVFAEGRGELFHEVDFTLKGKYLVLVKPEVHVPTAIAYSRVTPCVPQENLVERVNSSVDEWQGSVKNDFEPSVFNEFPIVEEIKDNLYKLGAEYASMSGSGSSVFGIFKELPSGVKQTFDQYFVWTEEMR